MEFHKDLQNLNHLSRVPATLMAVDGLMSFTSAISQKVTCRRNSMQLFPPHTTHCTEGYAYSMHSVIFYIQCQVYAVFSPDCFDCIALLYTEAYGPPSLVLLVHSFIITCAISSSIFLSVVHQLLCGVVAEVLLFFFVRVTVFLVVS